MSRKFEVWFSMCHSECTEVELDEEDIADKTEGEIECLVEDIACRQIRRECIGYDPDEIISIEEIEED